jgi:hypothetical protein
MINRRGGSNDRGARALEDVRSQAVHDGDVLDP